MEYGHVDRIIQYMGMAEASFRQLAAFVAVAREESFSAAADELRYGQATVSQQVAALEKHIGARLFERPGGPKPISLTPLGRVLLPQAQHILEHLTNAELDIRDVDRYFPKRRGPPTTRRCSRPADEVSARDLLFVRRPEFRGLDRPPPRGRTRRDLH